MGRRLRGRRLGDRLAAAAECSDKMGQHFLGSGSPSAPQQMPHCPASCCLPPNPTHTHNPPHLCLRKAVAKAARRHQLQLAVGRGGQDFGLAVAVQVGLRSRMAAGMGRLKSKPLSHAGEPLGGGWLQAARRRCTLRTTIGGGTAAGCSSSSCAPSSCSSKW